MSDGLTTDRLVTLRNRWNSDPTSRIFLQLAEEHRHLGQIQEALTVLDRGLQEHPGYLSALVAKGRCHIELGEPEPARVVLERVVKQDATQMVANKLLVRAYLDTGDVSRARERLDLYRLLNDSDPEIEVLRRRILAMDQPSKPGSSAPQPQRESAAAALSPVFPDLPAVPKRDAPRTNPLDASDIFGLAPKETRKETPKLPPLWEPEGGPTQAFPLLPHLRSMDLPAVPFEPTRQEPFAAAPERNAPFSPPAAPPAGGLDVFPDLHAERSRDHYLAALGSEGLFTTAAPRPVAPPDVFDLAPPLAAVPAPIFEQLAVPEWLEPAPAPPAPLLDLPAEPDSSPFVFEPLEPVPSGLPPAREAQPLEPFPFAAVETPDEPFPFAAAELQPFAPAEPELEPWTAEALSETAPALSFFEIPPPEGPVESLFAEPEPDLEATAVTERSAAAAEGAEPEPISVAPPAALATVTLADLYVSQGHPAEAEKIYEEILRREPNSAAARSGLDRLARMERRLRPLEARDLLVDFQPAAVAAGGETDTPRVRHMLLSYLQRLRDRSPRDVS